MALNASGPISLGGATTGESINLELGLSGTATITLNDAGVRTLGGKASGAISLNDFYGKSNAPVTTVKTIVYGNTGPVPFAWTIPSDFYSLVSIEAIGSGGGVAATASSGGGGGGAYAKITSFPALTAGLFVNHQVNTANGSSSWFSIVNSTAPTSTSEGVLAANGSTSTTTTGGAGGTTAASIGTVKYAGGAGGAGALGKNTGGGGGGAAGPGGDGGNGSNSTGTTHGAGGSGAGSTSPGVNASGTTGGTAPTGGGNGGNSGSAGSAGSIWTNTSDSTTAGPGGGGGGNRQAGGARGGGRGGGGSSGSTLGAQGAIIFTYNAVV